MKKYEDISVQVPLYTYEYRVWRNENGKTRTEHKKERAVQWIACVLEHIDNYFELDECDKFWALFKVQRFLFEKKGIEPSEYLNDVMGEVLSAMYAELPRKGERVRSIILDHEYNFDVMEMWQEIDESYEPQDDPPKATKLKGAKRGQKRTKKN